MTSFLHTSHFLHTLLGGLFAAPARSASAKLIDAKGTERRVLFVRPLWSMLLVCTVSGLTLGSSVAHAALPSVQKVTAIGQAAIYGDDKAHARDKAIEDAMRKAVEQAIGAMVSSETVTENFELLSDKIISKSSGYVKKYKVVSESEEGGIVQVTIEAKVTTNDLQGDLDGVLAAVLKAKKKPRVLMMISEQNIGSPSGSNWWTGGAIDMGVTENAFMDAWLPKGIKFVDRQSLQGTLSVGNALNGVPTDGQIKSFASKSGAEVVIIGTAIANDAGAIMGTQMHSIRGNISLRALSLDTGDILATTTNSVAVGHIDLVTGGTLAFKKASVKAAGELLGKILSRWSKEITGPSEVSLEIRKVKKSKYLRLIAKFIRNRVRGVTEVNQRSYKRKVGTLEVLIKGDAQQLAEELEDKTFPKFVLEIEEITANKVIATMIGK